MRQVEPTSAGSFRVRFRHGTSPRTGRPLQCSETFSTRQEAERFAKWLEALGPQGALDQLYAAEQQAAMPTLNQVAADHIEHLTAVERGTRLTYQRLWDRTWGKHLGDLPANMVSSDAVKKAVGVLSQSYAHKSLENQRGLLAAVLNRAVEQGHLTTNPAKGVKLPRGAEAERTEMRILSPEEFATVQERLPDVARPLARFLFGTGCRWGEAVALTVADVALPNVRIRRALKWSPDNQRTVGATKTKKSNRTIVLPPELVEEVRALCKDKKGTDLVFTAPRGGAMPHRTYWSRYWLPAVSHLEPRPRIHDLRHSHASWLLANGTPIHVVQARLGHESIQTTVDTYGHLLPDAQIAAARAAQGAFSATRAAELPQR